MTPANTPDMSTYHVVHRALRVGARRLAEAVASIDPTDRRQASAQARWWKGYAGELLCHHQTEDEIFFPALVERVPVARELIGRTDADHAHMDELIEEIHRAMAEVAQGRAFAAAASALRELADHLDAHLDFEDEDILPLFARHFTATEYEELDERAVKSLGISAQVLFTVPFVMDVATSEEKAKALDGAPLPLKVLYRASRGRYARLTEAALGDTLMPAAAG